MITGGYLKDVSLPHKRRWPNEEGQREVRAQISNFVGGGGRHYHAHMEQEANPIWDKSDAADWGRPGEPKGWTRCWDDKKGKGALLSTRKFDTHIQATMWVERMMAERFPDHELIVNDFTSDFYYLHEGD